MIPLGVLAQRQAAAGAFSPLDLPGLIAWWDASDATTITEASGAVSEWRDKSGNGWHLAQSTAANQPTLGSIGTQTAVNVGNGRYLTHGAVFINRGTPVAWAGAGRLTVIQSGEPVIAYSTPSGPRPFYASATNFRAYGGSGAPLDGPARDTNSHTFVTNVDGANSSFTVDGTTYTGTLTQAGALAADALIGTTSTSWWGQATFGELIVCSPVSPAQIAALDTYLADRWGI